MSIFEQLRPFVSLCQACGMMPFTIEQNLITNKFEKFTFSFRHLTTWWFFLVLFVLHPALFFVSGYIAKDAPPDLLLGKDMPITVNIMLLVTTMCFIVELLLSRWIILHYRQLRNAIEAVQEVEQLLGKKFISQHQSSVTTRFVIGFILIISVSVGCVIANEPAYEALLPKNVNVFLMTLVYFVLVLIFVLFQCTYLLFYMCYYVIAHYVQLLLHSDVKERRIISLKAKESNDVMRRNVLIFDYLCRASQELNGIFSVPILILLTSKFISVVAFAFAYIYNKFIRYDDMLENHSLMFASMFFVYWIQIFVLLTAADMPANQVRLLRERVTAISSSGLSQSLDVKLLAMTSLVQIDEKRVRLSAAGLFEVGVHLIPTLAGAVVTYMVILLDT
ncbi:putative gustatory receptor 28b [Daphnia pulicaria]|uniref:putative gustatory receptor 28b n=1 Tax=Daphnia pulicaria TaxID=35523 RepID=UPI001EEC58B7|nr:putative gustatory receptor 28b [Daphnia pulicaria]